MHFFYIFMVCPKFNLSPGIKNWRVIMKQICLLLSWMEIFEWWKTIYYVLLLYYFNSQGVSHLIRIISLWITFYIYHFVLFSKCSEQISQTIWVMWAICASEDIKNQVRTNIYSLYRFTLNRSKFVYSIQRKAKHRVRQIRP